MRLLTPFYTPTPTFFRDREPNPDPDRLAGCERGRAGPDDLSGGSCGLCRLLPPDVALAGGPAPSPVRRRPGGRRGHAGDVPRGVAGGRWVRRRVGGRQCGRVA